MVHISSNFSAAPLPERTDVVIVGAGPTGLSLACALAARGVAFVIVDRAAEGGHTSRAAVVHTRTLEVLEEIGVTHELVSRGVVVPHLTIRDRDRTLLSIPFGALPTLYPYTLMVPQHITEQVLNERLAALGGWVHRERTMTDLEIGADGATAVVSGPDGASTQVRARYVVGCDGMHSVVREQAGIGFIGDRYAQSFVLADVQMDWPLARNEVQLFFSPAGLVVVAPLPEDRYRVVATLDHAPEHPGLDDVQDLLTARGPAAAPPKVRELVWSSRFSVHHRLAESYRRGPVFLAGDAAHVHSPAGGQGMNTGIQDAVTLGRHARRCPRRPRRSCAPGQLRDEPPTGCPRRRLHDPPDHPRSHRQAPSRPTAAQQRARPDRTTPTRTAQAGHEPVRAGHRPRTPTPHRRSNATVDLTYQPTTESRETQMSEHMRSPASTPSEHDVPDSWTRARLTDPSTAGFVHVGATSGPWRLPVALPRTRRREALTLMRTAATTLCRDARVIRADVFKALLRPPGQPTRSADQDVPAADFDAVLLIETTTVADAIELSADHVLTGLLTALHQTAERTLVFTGSNVRRIAPVDHDRQGVFLFNYFSANSVETNLFAWQYTAGWFQDQTGLDNSTVLHPSDHTVVPYSLVNHCRWDRLRDVLPALLLKRSFRSFVLRVFSENQVTPRPVLYKLYRKDLAARLASCKPRVTP